VDIISKLLLTALNPFKISLLKIMLNIAHSAIELIIIIAKSLVLAATIDFN